MSKEKEVKEENLSSGQEQPKSKKKSHKGAIITWSIIGTVVIATSGAMLFLLNKNKNASPTSTIQGKTFVADTSSTLVHIRQGSGGDDVDYNSRGKYVDAYLTSNSETNTTAKEILGNYNYYKSDTAKTKFKDSYFKVSKTNLFSYDKVVITLYSGSDSEWYHYSLANNSDKTGLKQYLEGDEKEQLTKLHTFVGPNMTIKVANTSPKATEKPYFTIKREFGTVEYGGMDYAYSVEVTYKLQ